MENRHTSYPRQGAHAAWYMLVSRTRPLASAHGTAHALHPRALVGHRGLHTALLLPTSRTMVVSVRRDPLPADKVGWDDPSAPHSTGLHTNGRTVHPSPLWAVVLEDRARHHLWRPCSSSNSRRLCHSRNISGQFQAARLPCRCPHHARHCLERKFTAFQSMCPHLMCVCQWRPFSFMQARSLRLLRWLPESLLERRRSEITCKT